MSSCESRQPSYNPDELVTSQRHSARTRVYAFACDTEDFVVFLSAIPVVNLGSSGVVWGGMHEWGPSAGYTDPP